MAFGRRDRSERRHPLLRENERDEPDRNIGRVVECGDQANSSRGRHARFVEVLLHQQSWLPLGRVGEGATEEVRSEAQFPFGGEDGDADLAPGGIRRRVLESIVQRRPRPHAMPRSVAGAPPSPVATGCAHELGPQGEAAA